MSKQELDTRELIADSLITLGSSLSPTPPRKQKPALLSRRWTVFQVPSTTTPNYLHYVVGTVLHGWRCSCIGYQAHGRCLHVKAVEGALASVASDRRKKRGKR